MGKVARMPNVGDIVRLVKSRNPRRGIAPGELCIVYDVEINMPVFINEAELYILGRAISLTLPFDYFELVEPAVPGRSTWDEVTAYYLKSRDEAMNKRRKELGLNK